MYSTRLRIAQFVLCLNLSVDLSDVPWAYIIYMSNYLFPNLTEDCIRLSIRATATTSELATPVTYSYIHQSLPRTLPASCSITNGLLIENQKFEEPKDFVSLIRSVHNPHYYNAEPQCYLTRLPAGYYKLRNVSFTHREDDMPPKPIPLNRLWLDSHGELDFYMEKCPEPWSFLRPFVSVRSPLQLTSVPRNGWIPHVRVPELQRVEGLLRSVVLNNCGCNAGEETAYGHDVFHLDVVNHTGFGTSTRSWVTHAYSN